MKKLTAFEYLLIAALGVLCLLLFLGNPKMFSSRIMQEGWNLGHIALFFLAAHMAVRLLPVSRLSYPVQLIVLCGGAGVIGGAVELLQARIGRSASLSDLSKDILGVILYFAFAHPALKRMRKGSRRGLAVAAILISLGPLYPMARIVIDDMTEESQFPVLANFETPFELSRFDSNGIIEKDVTASCGDCLKVHLLPARFARLEMMNFVGDWSGMKTLSFTFHNPSPEAVKLNLRIHDKHHRNFYNDRFNTEVKVFSGTNTYSIPLKSVASGPKGRAMDMEHIAGVIFFIVDLKSPVTLYLDKVELR